MDKNELVLELVKFLSDTKDPLDKISYRDGNEDLEIVLVKHLRKIEVRVGPYPF